MIKFKRILPLMAFGLPLTAFAAVPVIDGNAAGGYSSAAYGGATSYAEAGAAAPVSAQGQVFMQLQQLQQEVQQLRGLIEEQQNEIRVLKQENLDRYQELDRRLGGGATGVQQNQGQSPGAVNGGNMPLMPAAPAQSPAASAEPADPEKEKLYYDAAFDLIKTRDFAKASQAFTGFLRKYPNSQYAGNAQYWLGEVSLAQGDLPAAAQAFAQVGKSYPDHQKVPDALYKQADVELRQGNTAQAKTILQQVVSQYPGSSAAQLAQRELSGL